MIALTSASFKFEHAYRKYLVDNFNATYNMLAREDVAFTTKKDVTKVLKWIKEHELMFILSGGHEK